MPGKTIYKKVFTDQERIEALDRVISMFKTGDEESAIGRAKIITDMEEEKRILIEKIQK